MNSHDSLLIVHASDSRISKYLDPNEAMQLKNNISGRIKLYIKEDKKVFYTPYLNNERSCPEYFPKSDNIILIKNPNELAFPSSKLIEFQVISLLDKIRGLNIHIMEVGGVAIYACLKGTIKKIKSLEIEGIEDYCEFYDLDISRYSSLADFRISAVVNHKITDEVIGNLRR